MSTESYRVQQVRDYLKQHLYDPDSVVLAEKPSTGLLDPGGIYVSFSGVTGLLFLYQEYPYQSSSEPVERRIKRFIDAYRVVDTPIGRRCLFTLQKLETAMFLDRFAYTVNLRALAAESAPCVPALISAIAWQPFAKVHLFGIQAVNNDASEIAALDLLRVDKFDGVKIDCSRFGKAMITAKTIEELRTFIEKYSLRVLPCDIDNTATLQPSQAIQSLANDTVFTDQP